MSDIMSRPATNAYRDGWERTYGAKERVAKAVEVVRERLGLPPGAMVPGNEVAKELFPLTLFQPVEEDASTK